MHFAVKSDYFTSVHFSQSCMYVVSNLRMIRLGLKATLEKKGGFKG